MKVFFSHCADRFWLFTIAAISLGIVGGMIGAVILKGGMPEGAGELFAGALTGLLLIVQKVIDAQQARKMADQLHQSTPTPPGTTQGEVHWPEGKE